jgi:hypothetical protein
MNQLYSFFYQRNLIKAISFDDNYLSLRFIAMADTMISSQTEKSKSKSLNHLYSILSQKSATILPIHKKYNSKLSKPP